MYITVADVRDYIKDKTAEDNHLLAGELRYSDEEIERALVYAVREFNSIPPIGVLRVEPGHVPGDTNVFLDGAAAALLRTTLLKESANDITVNAGNMGVQVTSTQIGHIHKLIPIFETRFRQAATDIKLSANLAQAFGAVGGTF